MRKLFLLLLSCGFVLLTNAQSYFNEWINFNQTYYKIKVAEEGVYRISVSDLTNAGFITAGANINNFQLFFNGQEQHIFVQDFDGNNNFNAGDYIEFYGKGNDGVLDSSVYMNQNDITHQYYSLFTDTAAYFLTLGTSPGLRISNHDGTNISGTAESHYIHEHLELYTSTYHKGEPILSRAYLSNYVIAEGWFGPLFRRGNTYDLSIPSNNLFASGPSPSVEILGVGVSDYFGSPNHHLRVSVGPNTGSLTQIIDSTYRGYTSFKFNRNLAAGNIGTNTIFRFEVVNDLGLGQDDNAIAYIKLKYPRDFNLNNSSERSFNFTGTAGNSRLAFTNFSGSNPFLYDFTNNLKIQGNLSGGTFEVMVPNAGSEKHLYLMDDSDAKPINIQPINFRDLDPQNNNWKYIILTHESLLDSARVYAEYRASAAGGNHDTLVVTSQQLYDQFYYGLYHPSAVKNFVKYLITEQSQEPEFLLLLGKGYQTDLARTAEYKPINLVPTYGVLGSDNMLTYGVNGTQYDPAIPVGRVSAKSPKEVGDYLCKVKQYESKGKEIWMKNVLATTGSNYASEVPRFTSYMNTFIHNLNNGYMAPIVTNYDKDPSKPETFDPKQFIIDQINEGIGMYTYFGHGADLSIAVDMGNARDYNNECKYPFMFFSGCRVGDAFSGFSIGEEFVLEPKKGAIAWLAQSDLGFEALLLQIGDLFTENLSKDFYGEPIAKVVQETLKEFPISNVLSITHAQQTVFQGDPAIKMYSFDKPDYFFDSIFVKDKNFIATGSDFELCFIIKNCGRLTADSIDIRMQRTLPDFSSVEYLLRIPAVLYSDTICFTIPLKNKLAAGINNFEFFIDPASRIDELSEINNNKLFNYIIDESLPNLILPKEYAIVSNSSVDLIIQDDNLKAELEDYVIQIDTVPTFDSPWKMTQILTPNYSFTEWNVNLPQNNTVYYWRARWVSSFNWKNSSFTYINGSPDGWNQSHFGQYQKIKATNINLDFSNRTFDFVRDQVKITARVNRTLTGAPGANLGIRADENLLSGGSACGHKVRVAQFNAKTLEPFTYFSCNLKKSTTFDIANAAGRIDLTNFINTMPTENYFSLINIVGGAQHLQADPNLLLALGSLGADTDLINDLTNDHNYVFIGQKGFPALAKEDTTFGSERAIAELVAEGKWMKGSITSEIIGPAAQWAELIYDFYQPGDPLNDDISFDILGINPDGTETILINQVSGSPIPIASIDAATYPFIKLRANLYDSLERTVPQLKSWKVLYECTPEGGIIIDANYSFNKDTLTTSDTLQMVYKYKNLTGIISDSLFIDYKITTASDSVMYFYDTIPPLNPNQEYLIEFEKEIAGFNRTGLNCLDIEIFPQNLNREQFHPNNIFSELFFVNGNPLDVELLNFEAQINAPNLVDLTWQTVQETNNAYFILERKLENEQSFKAIAQIIGAGTTNEIQNYFHQDDVKDVGVNLIYYRLKQVDFDNSSAYSEIRTVYLNPNNDLEISVFPIPTQEILNLKLNLPEETNLKIEMLNELGQQVLPIEMLKNLPAGNKLKTIDVKSLTNGIYHLKITLNEAIFYRRIIIAN